MAVATRIKPTEIFTDQEWKDLITPSQWYGPYMVAHGWGVIILTIILCIQWLNPLTFILAVMIIGSRQLGISILMHEAAHNALHPNQKINHFLGQWLCAAPLGVDLIGYRAYHLQHHKYGQQPEDPDLALTANFPVPKQSMRRKFIRDLTGQTFYKQRLGLFLLAMGKIAPPNDIATVNGVQDFKKVFRNFVGTNLILFATFVLCGVWWGYFAFWLLPMAVWLPIITRIRNIAEHATLPVSNDPLSHARTTHASWLARIFIAPYHVHWHAEHHAFMYMPCHRLRKAHTLLRQKKLAHRIPQSNSYLDILREATL